MSFGLKKKQYLSLAVLLAASLTGTSAMAAPFITATLTATKSGSGNPYSSTLNVAAGETYDYKITFTLAPVGTTNVNPAGSANDTINSYTASTLNGLNNIKFSLFESTGQQIQTNFTSLGVLGADWDNGTGQTPGTLTARGNGNNDVIGAFAITDSGLFRGVPSANTPATTEVYAGQFTIASVGSGTTSNVSIGTQGFTGTIAAMKYNSTGTYSATTVHQAGADPGLLFQGLTLNVLASGNNSTLYVGGAPAPDGSSSASPGGVNVGRVMLNTVLSSDVALNKNGSDGTTYAVSVTGNATSSSVTAGTSYVATPNINAGVDTTTTGVKSGTVVIDNLASDSAAAGQGSADANDTINVSATVVQNRVVTATPVDFGKVLKGASVSTTTTLSSPGALNSNTSVYVTNPGADVNGIAVTGGTLVNGANRFNGTNVNDVRNVGGVLNAYGSIVAQGITLTTNAEGLIGENPINVNVAYSATVGNATAKIGGGFDNGNALTAPAGSTVAGLASKVTANGSLGDFQSEAVILQATAATNANPISMNWRERTAAEETPGDPVNGGGGRYLGSDVVDLTGIDGGASIYALQLKYDSSSFASDAAEVAAAQAGYLYLGWLNAGTWVNAGIGAPDINGYAPEDFVLGKWGINAANDTVWAVVNHNSEFAAVIPEPASLSLLALGGLALTARRRRHN